MTNCTSSLKRGLVLTVALLALASTEWTSAERGDQTLVVSKQVDGRGKARLYAFVRSHRLCLKLVRRFRRGGRRRIDDWTSCGLPRRSRGRLIVRRRAACYARELQAMGITPERTYRLRGRLDNGRRIAPHAYDPPADVVPRGKLFMRISRGAEVTSLRAIDEKGRKLASVRLAPFRGSPCG